MPRACLACSHPDRAAIDKAIAHGEPLRSIANRYTISHTSVLRHKSHIAHELLAEPRDVRASKSFSLLPPRKQKYVQGRAEGKTKVQAALDAGYSEGMARAASAKIETSDVLLAFKELMRQHIPPEKIAQRIICNSQELTLHLVLSDGVATVGQNLQ